MKKTLRAISFCLILLSVWGCGRHSTSGTKMIFRYNEASGITSLDPLKANSLANIWAVQQLYNGLVQLDSAMNVQPCIAREWEVLDSGKLYVFHLRTDISFHPDASFASAQRTVKASDVVFSFARIVSQNGPQWVLQQVSDRAGGTKAIEAVNDSTVHIMLDEPFAQFLQVLTMPYCFIVPQKAAEFYGDDFGRHPVGTGPFCLRRWHDGEKLVLNRNEEYFEHDVGGNRLPYLDGVSVTFVKDRQTAFLEFVEGRIDMMSGLDAAYKDELLTPYGTLNPYYSTKAYLQKIPYLNTEYLGINLDAATGGPLADRHVRMALSAALDRKQLIAYIRNGIGMPASGFVPPALLDMKPAEAETDDDVNKHLLNSSYKNVRNVPPFVLYTDVAYVDLCTAILSQWKRYGFRVSLEVLDRPTLKSQVAKGQLIFFRGSWIADYPDAENYLSLFYTPNFSPAGPNYTHFSKEKFDAMYRNCLAETNDSLRRIFYRQMDSLVMSEAPVIPLFFDEVTRFVRTEVTGLPPHPMNHLDLKRVRKSNK